jgi:hypothetical protein
MVEARGGVVFVFRIDDAVVVLMASLVRGFASV